MNEALKSCPFCGGKVERRFSPKMLVYIECSNCGIRTDYYLSETWLARTWNRREGGEKDGERH